MTHITIYPEVEVDLSEFVYDNKFDLISEMIDQYPSAIIREFDEADIVEEFGTSLFDHFDRESLLEYLTDNGGNPIADDVIIRFLRQLNLPHLLELVSEAILERVKVVTKQADEDVTQAYEQLQEVMADRNALKERLDTVEGAFMPAAAAKREAEAEKPEEEKGSEKFGESNKDQNDG